MPVLTLSKAINTGLRQALEDNPKTIVMGQDVGGLGGVFRVTDGLQKDFGTDRVIDTPLAESGIIGTAIGLALRGYRPICEIQFDGFVYPAFNQIVSQLAKIRARTEGRISLPVVIRIPVGGGIGAVEHHSESNESYFAHTAGLRVVCCSDPQDGHWMLRQAAAGNDPVIFYEPKRRYWSKAEVADSADERVIPLHKARVIRAGSDLTLLSYGGMVDTCLKAAEAAVEDGRSIEVIDLRTLSPLDLETISASVNRTGRCVVVHEAPTFVGLGAEIGSAVTERCFYRLDAPVLRVGGFDMPYPPAKFEDHYVPDLDRVLDAVDRSFGW
ncbi:alpha-ketoacid dehydrogenase subunit beta [Streptomyces chartreusis]|uniref:3-methyl-2-oxobutanoate dehydrogenase (2-methylpropanoyl-transferring) n=1 Tax=Streptomyces chartreusis TaxID=1969 RepID=A0A7I0Y8X2_STRCX|nr:alpha-ketoacid dehydrogenase subunit beta [Streptomyces chartreusis]QKZ15953.1 alpha-ketoacid dehydrogenase subunit beta [Streptomyces chartreusis]